MIEVPPPHKTKDEDRGRFLQKIAIYYRHIKTNKNYNKSATFSDYFNTKNIDDISRDYSVTKNINNSKRLDESRNRNMSKEINDLSKEERYKYI